MVMCYDDYQINDFVTDPSFRQWVISPDEGSKAFWYRWTLQHPEKSEMIQQARMLVKATHMQGIRYHEENFYTIRKHIKASLFQKKNDNKESIYTRVFKKANASYGPKPVAGLTYSNIHIYLNKKLMI